MVRCTTRLAAVRLARTEFMTAPLPPTLLFPQSTPPAPGEIIDVAPGIRWLRMPLPFALDHINLWLLADEIAGVEGWTAVDTGYGNDATRELWAQHLGDNLDGRPLLRVITTHYHPDHMGNAAWLPRRPCELRLADPSLHRPCRRVRVRGRSG